MIKKITIIFCFYIFLFSCGKKGDPVFKEQDTKKFDIKLKVVS